MDSDLTGSRQNLTGPDEYITYGSTPTMLYHAASLHPKLGMPAKAKVGHNIIHNVNRAAAAHLPLDARGIPLMQTRHRLKRFARLADDSLTAMKNGWKHWESFCKRFDRPRFLRVDKAVQQASASDPLRESTMWGPHSV